MQVAVDAAELLGGLTQRFRARRWPVPPAQYISLAFGRRLYEAGLVVSMGSVVNGWITWLPSRSSPPWECELLDRSRFATRTQARTAVFNYLEAFYNTRRRHSTLDYLSPADFERRHTTGYPAA